MFKLRLKFVAYTEQNILPKTCSRPEFPRGSTKKKSWMQQTRLKKHSMANLAKFPTLEKELMKYVIDSWKDSYALSAEMLRTKTLASSDAEQRYR